MYTGKHMFVNTELKRGWGFQTKYVVAVSDLFNLKLTGK